MPLRHSKYQIDRGRRSKKNQQDNDNEKEDASSLGNDEHEAENNNEQRRQSKKDDDDANYEQEDSESDDDDEDGHDGRNAVASRRDTKPASSSRQGRPAAFRDSDEESEFNEDDNGSSNSSEEEDTKPPAKIRAAAAAAAATKAPAKRGRGRPPGKKKKEAPSSEEEDYAAEEEASASEPEWPEEKDDPDDEDFIPTSNKPGRKRKGAVNSSSISEEEMFIDDEDLDDEEEDDDDDDELEDYKPARTKPKTTNSKPRPPVKKQRKQKRGSEDDNFFVDDDDEEALEEYKPASKKQTKAKSRRPPPPAKKQRQQKRVQDLDDEDEELDAELELDDDDEEVIGISPRRGRPSPQKTTGRRRRAIKDDSDDDDSDDDDDDDYASGPATKARPPTRSRRASSTLKPKSYREGSSGEEEEEEMASPNSRPRRGAASLATQKLKELNDSLDENENDDDEEEEQEEMDAWGNPNPNWKGHTQQVATSSPTKQLSSDEEFLADDASENTADKDVFYTDSEDEEVVDASGSPSAKQRKAVNIDNEDIGSADDSSNSDEDRANGAHHKQTPDTPSSKRSQLEEIRPSPHKSSLDDDDDGDDSDDSDGHAPMRLPDCPSLEDAITADQLPKIHVCYVSPDGQSRQCFAIETLRQIALKSGHLPFRVDLDGSEQDTFLQPPHFRTPMSDDLLDQIASRFGRGALNLHGDFYNRKSNNFMRTGNNGHSHDTYEDVFGNVDLEFGEEFVERVQKYMSGQMGSRDVYACPLCYSEMHRRIVRMDQKTPRNTTNDDADDCDDEITDDEKFLELPADSSFDPMTVLGWLDDDKFQAAACFCFGKVANLKKHLRNDHSAETKGIQGNDLYQRFRIRGQDGLLQRYLHKYWKKMNCPTFQGAMQKYWFEGHNQSFVYLLNLMEDAHTFLEVIQRGNSEDDNLERAETFFDVATAFFQSIQGRAQLEWEQISAPFLRGTQQDELEDFVVEGGDDPEDALPHFSAHRQFLQQEEDSTPNDFLHKLERKVEELERGGSSGEEDEVPGESGDEGNEDVVSVTSDLKRRGYYSEEEEEKDEWMRNLQDRRKLKKSPAEVEAKARPSIAEATPKGRKLTRRKSTTPSTPAAVVSVPTPASKRRSIAEESSSEGDFDEGFDV
jgi:hypothetical protein